MSDQSQGEGWWIASDGKWYPPHTHPQAWAAPSQYEPPPVVVQGSTSKKRAGTGCAIAAVVVAAFLAVAMIGVLVLALLMAEPGPGEDTAATTSIVSDTTSIEPSDSIGGATKGSESTVPSSIGSDSSGLLPIPNLGPTAGTRTDPVSPGGIGLVDGWLVRVNQVDPDGWPEIRSENSFNEAPADGMQFVLAEVTATYVGLEEPQLPWISLSFTAVADTGVEREDRCGVLPDALDDFSNVFSGGSITGNVCIAMPVDDVASALLVVSAGFFGDQHFFSLASDGAEPTPMPDYSGPASGAALTDARLVPTSVGTALEIGQGWTVTVRSSADSTVDVLAENQFNEPPPSGYRFVSVSITASYDGDRDPASLFDLGFGLVGTTNVSFIDYCGVVPEALDQFVDIYRGASVEGAICFIVPESELGSELFYVASENGQHYAFFDLVR